MRYFRPDSLDEALKRLAEFDDARPIAGGATLVAMMNSDLLAPTALVSLAAIDELAGICASTDGIVIGAMTRHAVVAGDMRLRGDMAVIRLAAAEIGHPAIRAVGTIGGSIAHADPAADYPTALTAAGAEIEILGSGGRRRIAAAAFFEGFYTTALADGELITAVHLPPPRADGTAVYRKIARSDGDFAIASMAFAGVFDGARCRRARIAVGGCGSTPIHSDAVDAMLIDATPEDACVADAAAALAAACDPMDDVRGSASYRRLLVRRLLPQVFAEACECSPERSQ
ncbi:MAG: FAD binding domain-containing protein [Gammaproteobacteria bacterium]|jgi:carbon-monoxide dehydrogenase medium subunit